MGGVIRADLDISRSEGITHTVYAVSRVIDL